MADGGLGGGGAPLQRPGAPSSRSRTGAGAAGAGAAPYRQTAVLQRPLCPGQQRSRRSATADAGAMEEEGGAGAGAAAPVRARPARAAKRPRQASPVPGAVLPRDQRPRSRVPFAQRSDPMPRLVPLTVSEADHAFLLSSMAALLEAMPHTGTQFEAALTPSERAALAEGTTMSPEDAAACFGGCL